MAHIRTCQECGHKQKDTDPRTKTFASPSAREAWMNMFMMRQCKRCKSEALDFGSSDVRDYSEDM